jgi:hypothetical protein
MPLSKVAIVRPHLITLSALASTLGGMVRPICLAVFKLKRSCLVCGNLLRLPFLID